MLNFHRKPQHLSFNLTAFYTMLCEIPAYLCVLAALLTKIQVQCCTKATFERTELTAVKNVLLHGEVTDYNFFSKAKAENVASIRHVTGCITPVDELEDVVAIQIRGERVPIFYEGAVQNLPYLHSFHVVSSEVNILKPKAFQNLPSLSVIKIQGNAIESIPSDVFNNLQITRLILTFNNITYISPEAFDDMPRLESVNLEGNKLANWNINWFRNCPKVAFLSVKFNRLSSLQARAFRNMQEKLERLYLSDNNIQDVSARTFSGLKNLTDLSLLGNNITGLDDLTFLYLENLKMIDLSETSISCFSDSFLNTLRSDVLLWIDNIPLNSTCKLVLEEWARDSNNTLTFFKTLKTTTSKLNITHIF